MRTPLLAANWKMHMLRREAKNMLEDLLQEIGSDLRGREVLICPPAQLLTEVHGVLSGSANVHLGAQNLHWEEKGAFTGEISGAMVRDTGANYVLVGHSERRSLFGDSDENCRLKVAAAAAAGLIPVLCVGEVLEQREAGQTDEVIVGQLKAALEGFSLDSGSKLVIAYEPVWAIGTGRTASPEDADLAMGALRSALGELYGERLANQIRILYGGSVKPGNVDSLMSKENIDGALVGGASLKADSFARIVKFQATAEV